MKKLGISLVMLLVMLAWGCGGESVDPVRSQTVHKYRGGAKSSTMPAPAPESNQADPGR